jgi:hypothetical protein
MVRQDVRIDRFAPGWMRRADFGGRGVEPVCAPDVRPRFSPRLSSPQGGASLMRNHNKAFCRLVVETFDCSGLDFEFGSYQVEGQEGYAKLRHLFPGKATSVATSGPAPPWIASRTSQPSEAVLRPESPGGPGGVSLRCCQGILRASV